MSGAQPTGVRRPSILIVGDDFGFPYGAGASSRVFNYAKGLLMAGADVKVLLAGVGDSADPGHNTMTRGEYRGVPFEYTNGRTTRSTSFVRRRVMHLLRWPRFALAVRRWSRRTGGLDAMLVYSRQLRWVAAAWLLCRRLGATVLHEDCELPYAWDAPTPSMLARRWLYERVAFKAFDGCLAISTRLEAYCRDHLRPNARTLMVPTLVDVAEITASIGDDTASEDRVVYCGNMEAEIRAAVEAFAVVARDFPGLRLLVVGGPRQAPAALLDRLPELSIVDRVEFVGMVKRETLFELLGRARVLILPRAAAAFSQAGLPTKVAEYLAGGRPVVVTAVGDLPLYLTDGVDAYLASSNDAQVFGQRLRDALSRPDEATEVGRRGRETATARFDPAVHGARIIAFVADLRQADARSGVRGEPARRTVGREKR